MMWLYMFFIIQKVLKNPDGIANSLDPDTTAPYFILDMFVQN